MALGEEWHGALILHAVRARHPGTAPRRQLRLARRTGSIPPVAAVFPGLRTPRPALVHAIAVLGGIGIFAVDALFPTGSAVGMLYVAVILLGLWTPWAPFPWVAAGAASLLAVADVLLDASPAVPLVGIGNRVLMVMVFGLTALLVERSARFQREGLAHLTALADFKRALDAAAIVATTDVRGRITYVNDTFCRISGYSRDELLGQDHRIINSGHHPSTFIRNLWQTIARGEVWHGEIRNRAKQGHYYWVDTTIVPFLDVRGKPYQYIAIRSDITARKAAEEQLARQAALARVGHMAAVLAHEIRNPLAGIKGAIEVIASRRAADDPERPIMRDIVSRIESLGELLNDVMVFARPRPPAFATVPLRGLVLDAMTLLRRDPITANVTLEVCADEEVAAAVDADLIRATLVNLLLNAAQAMQGKGRVDVTITRRDATAVIDLRDTGPGIPVELREQIFEPFFTTKARGGGLGLSVAQRTAELHRGSLTLRCPPEGGTVMTLTLPLRQPGVEPPVSAA